jgi:quinol monooxygenase YgiN
MNLSLLRIVPDAERRKDVLDILLSITGPTLAQPGCIRCEVSEGIHNDSILFIEEWKTETDMVQHLGSSLYGRVLAAMEFSATPPEIFFFDRARSRGLELVEGVRSTTTQHHLDGRA